MTQASDTSYRNYSDMVREREDRELSPRATRSYDDIIRDRDENDSCSLRTPFQVDRDRILHSKSFRRLMSKTQVFIAPEDDHYRTRLTHTLEVTAISRTVARSLGLNEDLTEAVGLGHDLGHPPFGHTGEHALDAALTERFGRRFLHNHQSVRVVEILEKDGQGLNLTSHVREGILCHTGENLSSHLEGQVVRIVDRIAYINHDIDDAIRAGLLVREDLPKAPIDLLGATGSARIDRLVHDLVECSHDADVIQQSPEVGAAMLKLRSFMFDNVYLGEAHNPDKERVAELMPRLVDHFIDNPDQIPLHYCAAIRDEDLPQRVTDYIAGMTDRYCLRLFKELFMPREWGFR